MKKRILIIVFAGVLTAGSVVLAKDVDLPTMQSKERVTIQEAKEIALEEVDGNVTSAALDTDNGKIYYEININDGTTTYVFEIDAITGKVIEFNQEVKQVDKKKEATKRSANKQIDAAKQSTSALTIDDAIAIAKQHVTGFVIKVGRDEDVFEIEMEDGKKQYDIEIDAVTGEIITFDKESDE